MAAIWSELLGLKHIGLDDNFFDLGGHSFLVAVLQQRIATVFGQHATIAELFYRPTVRQQAELSWRLAQEKSQRVPGVTALNSGGTRNPIFWVHYLDRNLAEAVGNGQPFLVVTLTAEDVATLGEAPTMRELDTAGMSARHATRAIDGRAQRLCGNAGTPLDALGAFHAALRSAPLCPVRRVCSRNIR